MRLSLSLSLSLSLQGSCRLWQDQGEVMLGMRGGEGLWGFLLHQSWAGAPWEVEVRWVKREQTDRGMGMRFYLGNKMVMQQGGK